MALQKSSYRTKNHLQVYFDIFFYIGEATYETLNIMHIVCTTAYIYIFLYLVGHFHVAEMQALFGNRIVINSDIYFTNVHTRLVVLFILMLKTSVDWESSVAKRQIIKSHSPLPLYDLWIDFISSLWIYIYLEFEALFELHKTGFSKYSMSSMKIQFHFDFKIEYCFSFHNILFDCGYQENGMKKHFRKISNSFKIQKGYFIDSHKLKRKIKANRQTNTKMLTAIYSQYTKTAKRIKNLLH